MTPISTYYKGFRFRSRLEARWAICLDFLGWEWEYEPEGYEFSDGTRYLPDFRLKCAPTMPNNPANVAWAKGPWWIEVKRSDPTALEIDLARSLSKEGGGCVAFAIGNPCPYTLGSGLPVVGGISNFEYEKYGVGLTTWFRKRWGHPCYQPADEPAVQDVVACAAATSARFEFGETGPTNWGTV